MQFGKEITTDELKKIQYNLLKDIAGFCDSNDIHYYLAYGTLIGAVRHQGFIPWDDDIDIALPRSDYDRLLTLYNKMNQGGPYYLVSPYDDMSCFTYAKLIDLSTIKIEKNAKRTQNNCLGVDIDLFPIDRLPGDHHKHLKLHRIKQFIYELDRFRVTDMPIKTIKGKVVVAISKAIGHKRWTKLAERLTIRYSKKATGRSGINTCLYNFEREWHEDSVFQDRCQLRFEGGLFWAPCHYHELLTDIYGDYMKLPPENQRTSTHEYRVYWKVTD